MELDDYELIYEYDFDDHELLTEEAIEEIRGNIGRGDCVYCGAKHAMEYIGDICFICSSCGKSVHEDIYYRWALGYEINLEET